MKNTRAREIHLMKIAEQVRLKRIADSVKAHLHCKLHYDKFCVKRRVNIRTHNYG
jgi:hypothetical protein